MPERQEAVQKHYDMILTKYFKGEIDGDLDKNQLSSALNREATEDVVPFSKERIYGLLPHQHKSEDLVDILKEYYVDRSGIQPDPETGFVAVITEPDRWMIGIENAEGNITLGGIWGFWPKTKEMAITLRENGGQTIKPISLTPDQGVRWVGYTADYQPIGPQSV